jgi:hypothetical protein
MDGAMLSWFFPGISRGQSLVSWRCDGNLHPVLRIPFNNFDRLIYAPDWMTETFSISLQFIDDLTKIPIRRKFAVKQTAAVQKVVFGINKFAPRSMPQFKLISEAPRHYPGSGSRCSTRWRKPPDAPLDPDCSHTVTAFRHAS